MTMLWVRRQVSDPVPNSQGPSSSRGTHQARCCTRSTERLYCLSQMPPWSWSIVRNSVKSRKASHNARLCSSKQQASWLDCYFLRFLLWWWRWWWWLCVYYVYARLCHGTHVGIREQPCWVCLLFFGLFFPIFVWALGMILWLPSLRMKKYLYHQSHLTSPGLILYREFWEWDREGFENLYTITQHPSAGKPLHTCKRNTNDPGDDWKPGRLETNHRERRPHWLKCFEVNFYPIFGQN